MEPLHVLIIIAVVLVLVAIPVTAIVLLVTFLIGRDRRRRGGADTGTTT